ncbi:NADH-quinone oxidoreductase subunit NuoG [Aeromonas veronii]|uniref:NADH-quinone oxidoreductase subunit NuoG n=1 Tax=Aeromonas veronii TaxID=654 RepID=UPI0018802A9B|nr:NADH-quinone oxidoreductase subunit NuoG [Aeromonas veronii]MBE8734070.1 NADH-quinone oxidoreductase subunit NuoG [Aeromonas veronii]MBE8740818.1 NADH-quinone oxidoreductase subunit NuoG [Aeromonas veronii]MBE8742056.1 NADH-quinone oxidoreductase subunit NuoG [Aeromonas veronii]MBE8765674.1 NADH-quinone oxidoreductase subunit NuoG [Aeromonas veronii]MBE8838018.1 NADH-quinone oxidoreductase subunit NuoG [Aeromonas veronii]
MATIYVDGKEYEVDGADNLLQACLSLGLDVPYFCWHPALGSVGACRQCAVKQYQNADDKRGRLVMSCMTPATDGSYIAIEDEEAKEFRKSVVEWLMTNHPHDCPVCEEGGACHLQDMTVMTGHNSRRYRFTKRTHQNQELGPFIGHEMNRCIACYRCVRYYKDYAGGEDLGVYGAHDNVYFGRVEDGTLESEFSGNLVEVCPTGVFTDKTHSERYNRKWDMQFAPSICQQCSVGCNISPGERYGELRRIENRFHGSVNHYFLCDRGRFGYGYVNLADRPRQPLLKDGNDQLAITVDGALNRAADALRTARGLIGIGSPRASLESNFALRELVGADNFYAGVEQTEWACQQQMLQILQHGNVPTPSLRDIEEADAILVLGEDVTMSAARIALALRQAVKGKARELARKMKVDLWQVAAVQTLGQNERYPLLITSLDTTRLDDVAADMLHAPYADQARLGFAIANLLDPSAPAVADLSPEQQVQAARWAELLGNAKKPLIIAGSSARDVALLEAASNIARALKGRGLEASIALVGQEANSLGLAMLGAQTLTDKPLEAALARIEAEEGLALVTLENDLYRRAPRNRVDAALARLQHLLVIDHQATPTANKADLVLPAASFAEADGTLVNMEGRAQRFFQVYAPAFYNADIQVREGWRWLAALQGAIERKPLRWQNFEQISHACASSHPLLATMLEAAPNAGLRIRGMRLAREPHRYSGRTSMLADQNVSEPRVAQDPDSPFNFSMEGYAGARQPLPQVPFAWAPGWNSPSAWNKFQDEVGGKLRAGDPGRRLLEATDPQAEGKELLGWFTTIPAPFKAAEALQVVNYAQLFGGEELSARSPVIQARMNEPELVLNPADAQRLALHGGSQVSFSWGGSHWQLRLRLSEQLSAGLVGLPLGVNGLPTALQQASITNLQEVIA